MKSHRNRLNDARSHALALGLCALLAPVAGFAELQISGLDDTLAANVRALSPLSTAACDTPQWRIERLVRRADDNVRQSLRALGYYNPVIGKSLRFDADCWHAEFVIDAGEPVRLAAVDVSIDGPAARDPEFLARITADAPQRGDVLHHGRYEDFKASFLRAATYTGYFDAEFEQSAVTVDADLLTADLALAFSSGPRYRVGEVTFTEGILRESLLLSYSDIRPGEPFSAERINDLHQVLAGSSYFRSVSIVTEPLDENARTVPVRVNLTPAKRRLFSAGGGFTTDMGPHVRFGYANRRRNDRGHQFESRLYLSEVDSELNTAYRWPRRDPRSDWYSVVGSAQHKETDTSEFDKVTLGVLRTEQLGRSWLETRYINYEWEDYRVGDQADTSRLLIIGSNWEKAVGRALGRATDGYRLNFDVRGASDSLGSDTSFLQLRTRLRWIRSFGDQTRLLARANLGLTAKDQLSQLPASVRFFSGGDRSVRGYEFQSLGPTDPEGNVLGGSHQVDLSVELDRLVRDNWAIAAFVDSGTAFEETDFDFSTGVGIGVRWYSPLGPIRLDLAHPLDDPDTSLRVHISLGPDL
jgi:translocation and assembly module TamA